LDRIGVHIGFSWENLKERENWEDLDVVWRIILKLILEKRDRGMCLIHLAQDKDQPWDFVSTVMNLPLP
jgi:hypothetical protein